MAFFMDDCDLFTCVIYTVLSLSFFLNFVYDPSCEDHFHLTMYYTHLSHEQPQREIAESRNACAKGFLV